MVGVKVGVISVVKPIARLEEPSGTAGDTRWSGRFACACDRERRQVSPAVASWNRIAIWLSRLNSIRCVAASNRCLGVPPGVALGSRRGWAYRRPCEAVAGPRPHTARASVYLPG